MMLHYGETLSPYPASRHHSRSGNRHPPRAECLLGSAEKREMALRKENREVVPRKRVNVFVYLLMLLLGPQLPLFVFVRLVETFIEIPDDQVVAVFITTCIFILTALLKIYFKVQ